MAHRTSEEVRTSARLSRRKVHASQYASRINGGTGITIGAEVNDAIKLRGWLPVGANVIAFDTGKSFIIEICVIRNPTGLDIQFAPAMSAVISLKCRTTSA